MPDVTICTYASSFLLSTTVNWAQILNCCTHRNKVLENKSSLLNEKLSGFIGHNTPNKKKKKIKEKGGLSWLLVAWATLISVALVHLTQVLLSPRFWFFCPWRLVSPYSAPCPIPRTTQVSSWWESSGTRKWSLWCALAYPRWINSIQWLGCSSVSGKY